eukprot:Unigene1220_Nuclearia_a/m.3884 Unigene1220_Nuclearia_a/g.3884  ORF Unigene1220_Nuclearia_a/g.3884 Unigene1220_Nuclearia_a/m.3884 type:complete len:521 (-) Unigene1220_Nuclearia_a:88-1650(-)
MSMPGSTPMRLCTARPGHAGFTSRQSSVAGAHGAAGTGEAKRRSPTGARASGTPRNVRTAPPLVTRPRTGPFFVVTTSYCACACAAAAAAAASAPAGELNFDDARVAFANKSTAELLRALMVFYVSAVPAVVQNSRTLLGLGERIAGKPLTHLLLRKTFFAHFCAGVDAQDIVPTIETLRRSGIGAILDYAAEADVGSDEGHATATATDAHVNTFLMCIETAALQTRGVAAMKLTGLAPPQLLERLSQLLVQARERNERPEQLFLSSLTPTEKDQLMHVERALRRVAGAAQDNAVRLLVDAEQSYFQPAIDYFVRNLQLDFNKGFPTVFNTYQCYLRDSSARVWADLEHAEANGYMFAAKLVRGAYMNQESQLAAAQNRENPIHPTLAATHANYNHVMETVIRARNREVMIASHNEQSVRRAIDLMKELKLAPYTSGISFGQLLGMCDHVSYTLGRHGYSVYKYVPYGPVGEVIPYLIRRAEENSAVMVGASKERRLLRNELLRRFSLAASPVTTTGASA